MADEGSSLAHALEEVKTIRRRFRGEIPFVQWPIPQHPSEWDDGEEPVKEHHPICTKSLELNAEALICMLKHYDGKFCDVQQLEREAWTPS